MSEADDRREGKPASGRKRRLWATRLGLVLCSLGIGLLVVEAAVRIIWGRGIVLYPRYHTGAEYGEYRIRRIRPDSRFKHTSRDGKWEFRTNAAGFRNDEDFDYEKPEGVFRVLCLGDSHTQGYEVEQEETFAAVIGRELAAAGLAAQSINAGVSGFSTAEALVLLENEGVRYAPDAVALGFFANDYEDNLKAGLFRLEEGGLKEVKHEHLPGVRIQDRLYSIPGTKWLGENSHAYAMAFNATWNFFKARLAARAREQAVVESAVPSKEAPDRRETELAVALLRRMVEFCREQAILLVVLDIPYIDAAGEPRSSVRPEIRALLAEENTMTLYFEDRLAGAAGSGELHVPHGQRHISRLAHRELGAAAAELILQRLKRERAKRHP